VFGKNNLNWCLVIFLYKLFDHFGLGAYMGIFSHTNKLTNKFTNWCWKIRICWKTGLKIKIGTTMKVAAGLLSHKMCHLTDMIIVLLYKYISLMKIINLICDFPGLYKENNPLNKFYYIFVISM
jgi:hypothetical protein